MASKRTKGPALLYPKPVYMSQSDPELDRWMANRAKVSTVKPFYVTNPDTQEMTNCDTRADARKVASKICDGCGKETHVMERATGKVLDSYETS